MTSPFSPSQFGPPFATARSHQFLSVQVLDQTKLIGKLDFPYQILNDKCVFCLAAFIFAQIKEVNPDVLYTLLFYKKVSHASSSRLS